MTNLGDNYPKNKSGGEEIQESRLLREEERNNMDQINPTVASWTPVEFLERWV